MRYNYRDYVPEIGDARYTNAKYFLQPALDIIRVDYYNRYHKDPSINPHNDNVVFLDDTLKLLGKCYCFRGRFPFRIYLQDSYSKLPNDTKSIALKIADDLSGKDLTDENLSFTYDLIKKFSGNAPNLVVANMEEGKYKYVISYISQRYFHSRYHTLSWAYEEFFDELCDNMFRNIIYIGDDLKKGVSEDTIRLVETKYVKYHLFELSKIFHMSVEELEEQNDSFRKRLFINNN